MSYLRKGLYVVAALLLATFALSASAQKTFMITPPSSLPVGTQLIQVIFTNGGNSNFNSFELDSTSSNITFNGTYNGFPAPTLSAGFTGTLTISNATTVQFVNTTPVKNKPVTITLSVTATDSSCASASGTWFGHAWTGSPSQPSQTFTLTPLPAATTINPSCSLAFVAQPANAFVNSVITTVPFNSTATSYVTVQALQGTTPVPNLSVSIVNTGPDTCQVSGSAMTDANGNAQFTSLTSSAASNTGPPPTHCQLLASASGYPSATSGTFDIVTDLGPLDCAPADGSHFGDLGSLLVTNTSPPVGDPTWGLLRGLNRTGDCTSKVPFTFTLNDDNTATFTEDSEGQQTSVEYLVRWAPVDTENGWSNFQPCISYGIANPVLTYDTTTGACFGDYVPAPACLVDDVNGPGDGTVVMPNFPTSFPYTAAASPHYAGTQAKVCVAQQGWNPDNGQVQFWHKFIDQTDTRIVGP